MKRYEKDEEIRDEMPERPRRDAHSREGRSEKPKKKWRLLRWFLFLMLLGPTLGALGIGGIFLYYGRDLPPYKSLHEYRPEQTVRVVARDGSPLAELYKNERRTVVAWKAIPTVVVDAIVASEDAGFWTHEGLNYFGMLRAFAVNVWHGKMRQGGSTITQQVVKNLVLSKEKSLERKVKEVLLALRLEQNFSKEEILTVYLNEVYWGHGRYGVAAAARHLFGKEISQVSMAEAAMLAAMLPSPDRFSPVANLKLARAKQGETLRRMAKAHEDGKLRGTYDAGSFEAAKGQALVLARPAADGLEKAAPHFVEAVRLDLEARYGADLYRSGMRVVTALDPALQRAAVAAVANGLAAIDRRFGYRGPEAQVDGAARAKLVSELKKEQAVLRPGAGVRGIVSAVAKDKVTVDLGIAKGVIALADLKWAKPVVVRGRSKSPHVAGDVLSVGDVVRVRVENLGAAEIRLALEQVPEIEGAFVAIDPSTREVVAMVGGQNWDASKFNRALQAKRQPGSAFKPILYAAAIVGKKLTLADQVVSAPYQFGVPGTTDFWAVKNYDGQSRGAIPVREALARSDNSVSARIIERIGVESVLDMARRLGVKSELPRYRSIALGAGEVTPLELTNAFATFAAGGVRAEPSFYRTKEAVAAETVLSPAEAFVMTSLLRAPVEHPAGTAGRLRALGAAVAGKTGTTSDHRDIWFVGYTRDLVAGVWVGYDDHRKIGGRATGGHDAIPIWQAFMKKVYEVRPKRDFGAPANVEFVNVVPGEGKRAPVGFPGAAREPFIPGTAPAEVAAMPGEITKATLERDETFQ